MKFHCYNYNQIPKEYQMMHEHIFNETAPLDIPSMVCIATTDDGEYLGFISGYLHNAVTLYVQKLGIRPDLKGKDLSVQCAQEAWQHFKSIGLQFLMGIVENTNIPTLLVSLHSGWVINGFHTDLGGHQYIQILKDLREGV
jgi:ribosomal protein S18 acetylase RimI-like enzyme